MWTFSFCSNARSFDRPTVAKSGEKIKVPIFIRRKGADAFRPALAAGGSLMAYKCLSLCGLFSFFKGFSNLLLTLRAGEQAGVEREAIFQPLDYCVYRSFQFGVQHHVLDTPSILKGRFDGRVGIEGRLTVNHLRRRVSRRGTDDGWKPLNAPHRVQSKAGTDSIIHRLISSGVRCPRNFRTLLLSTVKICSA